MYASSFGLTLDRVVALAVLVWIACNLLVFVGTALRGRPRGFALCLATSGITVPLLLALANPAAWVARVNLDRAQAGAGLDLHYLIDLGAEAVPPLLTAWSSLDWSTVDARQQCTAALYLSHTWSSQIRHPADWRRYNRGQARAFAAVAAHAEQLATTKQRTCTYTAPPTLAPIQRRGR